MSEGNKSRTVAATNMNSESSRSHAVFNIRLTQSVTDSDNGTIGEKSSKLSLVDLAGSERAQKTGAVGERLREGCNINRSLTTLMQVISALADSSGTTSKFVPYRDSVLTWLLKDNLGGNSRTVMIASLSPASDNYEETLSTLRYADRAKRIVNHAKVNADPNNKLIAELREELEQLRQELQFAKGERRAPESDLLEKLEESEKLVKELTKTWEEKLLETERIHKERHDALEKMGISVQNSGIKVEKNKFYLVNLNADPSLNELLVYYLKSTTTRVGSDSSNDIQLKGVAIKKDHCSIHLNNCQEVFVTPIEGARTLINGHCLSKKTVLRHGDRILWGTNHFFRLNCPKQPFAEIATFTDTLIENTTGGNLILTTDSSSSDVHTVECLADFKYAQEEVMMAELSDDPIKQAVQDLEKHYANEKAQALAQQRRDYEIQLNELMVRLAMQQQQPEQMQQQHVQLQHQRPLVESDLSQSVMHLPPADSTSSSIFIQSSGSKIYENDALPSDSGSMHSSRDFSRTNVLSPVVQQDFRARYEEWASEHKDCLKRSLTHLREQVSKTNALVREANFLSAELLKNTQYSVTLQIPVEQLSPNRRHSSRVAIEPTVLVKRYNHVNQVWSTEKLENRLVDMRESYQEFQEILDQNTSHSEHQSVDSVLKPTNTDRGSDSGTFCNDPFFDEHEDHALIGVANIYLRCLFAHTHFRYRTPIINQHGEIAGKLIIDLEVVKGRLPPLGTTIATGNTVTSSFMQNSFQTGFCCVSGRNNLITTPSVPVVDDVGDGVVNVVTNENDTLTSLTTSCVDSFCDIYPTEPHTVTVRTKIMQAVQLPASLANFVFCKYYFWGEPSPIMVPPALDPDYQKRCGDQVTCKFMHEAYYTVLVSDDLLEHFMEDALSVEVYGHRVQDVQCSRQFFGDKHLFNAAYGGTYRVLRDGDEGKNKDVPTSRMDLQHVDYNQDKNSSPGLNSSNLRKFADKWVELYRRLECWVAIEELNDMGQYIKVPVCSAPDVTCGGVYQLKHGQSRRMIVVIRPNELNSGRGLLPLLCDSIDEVKVGSVTSCLIESTASTNTLDSYQEHDLNFLRDCWSDAIHKKQMHLSEQLQRIVNLDVKSKSDEEREQSLIEQWMRLTEERNAVVLPSPGSGIPGAPANWNPPSFMERHCPLIFLNINVDEVPSKVPVAATANVPYDGILSPMNPLLASANAVTAVAGVNCRLALEEETHQHLLTQNRCRLIQNYLSLPLIKRYQNIIGAVAQWDASLHESLYLNRHTKPQERVYLIVKVIVRLSHPICIDVVLRKRICVHIGKGETSWRDSIKRRMHRLISAECSDTYWTGVTFQIVSSIPQTTLELEERESLAQMAGNPYENDNGFGENAESYIERYLKSVSFLENRLQLDRLRQEIALCEILTAKKRGNEPHFATSQFNPSSASAQLDTTPHPLHFSGSVKCGANGMSMAGLNQTTQLGKASGLTSTPNDGVAIEPGNRADTSGLPFCYMRNELSLRTPIFLASCTSSRDILEPSMKRYISVPNLYNADALSVNSTSTFVPAAGHYQHQTETIEKSRPVGLQSSSNTNGTPIMRSDFKPLASSRTELKSGQIIRRKRPDPPKSLFTTNDHTGFSQPADYSRKMGQGILTISGLDSSLDYMQDNSNLPLEPLDEFLNQATSNYNSGNNDDDDDNGSNKNSCIRQNPFNIPTVLSKTGRSCYSLGAMKGSQSKFSCDVSQCKLKMPKTSIAFHSHDAQLNEMADKGVSHDLSTFHNNSYIDWTNKLGCQVIVFLDDSSSREQLCGVIRFVGCTSFAEGIWIGVELDLPCGSSDGSVNDIFYFSCSPKHGLFVQADMLQLTDV